MPEVPDGLLAVLLIVEQLGVRVEHLLVQESYRRVRVDVLHCFYLVCHLGLRFETYMGLTALRLLLAFGRYDYVRDHQVRHLA